jgi:hypothetical protein
MSRNGTQPANWLLAFALILLSSLQATCVFGQGGVLANAEIDYAPLEIIDFAYDSSRDVIYASISWLSESPYANRIVTIDPDTLQILDSVYFGPKPTKLVVAPNGRRLFFALNLGQEVRWLDLATGELSPPVYPKTNFGGDATANEIILTPDSSRKMILAKADANRSFRVELEVRTVDGPISNLPQNAGPRWLTWLDDGTLIGYRSDLSPNLLFRYRYDGSALAPEGGTGFVNARFFGHYKASNGKLYDSAGLVLDPVSFAKIGQLPGDFPFKAAQLPNDLDDTSYVFDQGMLYLFDNTTLEEIDSIDLEPQLENSNTVYLRPAGPNRLLFTLDDGSLGVIRNVPFSVLPPPELVLGPRSENDTIVIDANAETVVSNGQLLDVSRYSRVTIYGGTGADSLQCTGLAGAAETAFIKNGTFQLLGSPIEFRLNGLEIIQFSGKDPIDQATVFVETGFNRLDGMPGGLMFFSADYYLEINQTGQILVFGNSESRANLAGSSQSDRLNGSLKNGYLRLSGENFSFALSGVPSVVVNAASGDDDRCSLIDSDQPDFFTAQGNYFRFTGNGYDFRGRNFDLVTANSDNAGRDRAALKRNPGDTLFQNGGNNMLIGNGYKNNARGFEVLRIE